ncbi:MULTISPECIES: tRNA1(Val) (adenine(37)-N6)-methyltransferase [Phyllobacterium]|jgi:tRNA1(Val) A37 N6-methylase TrmN6|uniref:Methyltransferase n=1 Tax=Phyllobacterium sophorae TaxID=1520277 RepID=A0A2P7B466_9HYPH|nr:MULTISPECIES: methyltransferase [Phyllobacterium]PSH61265.1 methyltransferase [Phyllobacterium sophorae]UXN63316.1 methyltransferase [Phyllobacterium sp. A18/5-2]
MLATDVTIDAFHRGRFHLLQPAAKGHRSGVDAMVLASVVPNEFSGRVADLGAGAGAAGLAVLSRCPDAQATLIERSEFMADFARRSLALEENKAFRGRAEVIEADVTLTGKSRTATGLSDNSFDFAIMNPPFNLPTDRSTPDPVKAEAHVMTHGMMERWIRTAAAIVKPGGSIGIIARPASITDLLDALRGRFGGLIIVPVQPRPQDAAIRIVIKGVSGSRAGLSLYPALIMHHEAGNGFTERAIAINNGLTSLF